MQHNEHPSSTPAPDRAMADTRRYSPVQRLLGSSRWIILLAVIGAFFSAMVLLLYAAGVVFVTIKDLVTDLHFNEKGAKELSVTFIQLVDLFLLGTVIYIIAIGLYELFIDDSLPMPGWLHIGTLDSLKEKLIGVVILLLGVTFLGQAVTWSGDDGIIYFGGAIALVIFGLVASMIVSRDDKSGKPER
jgi:uncharacterized membrane protein YqhA